MGQLLNHVTLGTLGANAPSTYGRDVALLGQRSGRAPSPGGRRSTYWQDTDEVAAFEELVGSHGGLGGGQSFPFALVPADCRVPNEPVVEAEAMHSHFRTWLADLGHASYGTAEPVMSSARGRG